MRDLETLDLSLSEDGIQTVTLDRPEHLNAFTVTMAEELVDTFERASADDDVAAVVVTGRGRAFCAGMDLSADGNVFGLDESLSPSPADLRDRLDDPEIVSGVRDTGGRVSLAVYACTKPVIAAINGPAVGIGATMTLPMDVRIASEKARIGFVFGKIGVVPEACSTWFLPRIVVHVAGARVGLQRRHHDRPGGPRGRPGALGAPRGRAARRGVRPGPPVHPQPLAGWPRRWRGR